jgi:hypothetical protein
VPIRSKSATRRGSNPAPLSGAPDKDRAEGEGEIMQTRSLLLGVVIGLFGALAVLTARYVAVVLAG